MIPPISMYGDSTGFIPSQVKKMKTIRNGQKLRWMGLVLFNWLSGLIKISGISIRIDITKAITPPNLLGTERKIAYANKKYHSGWMWTGVLIGLAGRKFSGSISMNGNCKFIIMKKKKKNTILTKSLIVKYGWNGILSVDDWIPNGLDDFSSWRKIKWITTSRQIKKGIK